jgi:uncharacterized membrane protein YphA (DoxX/SURF4 family)
VNSKITSILAFILAVIFIYAGVLKTMDATGFYKSIRIYQLLPSNLAWYLAHYLPWLEIAIGLGLLLKWLRAVAALMASVALLIFIAAIISAWWRGLDIECGCFGKSDISNNYGWLMIRDVLMLAASLYMFGSVSFTPSNRRVLENE